MNDEIDLVVPWVDGNDQAWQRQREKYKPENADSKNPSFFRDWGLMRYWFRGVEKYLPWIHKVYFLTWGHLPHWLNTAHPKLQIVRHEDFIPMEFCPTFSSIPIELNMHRIEGLSEQFIYSNDDLFFIGHEEPDYYFKDGLPCDCLCLQPITEACEDGFGHILWNNIAFINRHFSLKDCMKNNELKWFDSSYSSEVLERNKIGYSLRNFPGFRDEHLQISFLKSTFGEIWEKENHQLRQICSHRFRSNQDVIVWLMRYWQLAKGNFIPRMPKGVSISVAESKELLRDVILNSQNPVICLNESTEEIDFEERSAYLRSLFEIILPEMSSYELY